MKKQKHSIFDIYTNQDSVEAVAQGEIQISEAALHKVNIRNCFRFDPKECSGIGRFALDLWDIESRRSSGIPVAIQTPGFGALWSGNEGLDGDIPVLLKVSDAVKKEDSFYFNNRWFVGVACAKDVANTAVLAKDALADAAMHRADTPGVKAAVDLLVALCPPDAFGLTPEKQVEYEQLVRLKQVS